MPVNHGVGYLVVIRHVVLLAPTCCREAICLQQYYEGGIGMKPH
jgi:hypothetical protein